MKFLPFVFCVLLSFFVVASQFHVTGTIEQWTPEKTFIEKVETKLKDLPRIYTAINLLEPQAHPSIDIKIRDVRNPLEGVRFINLKDNRPLVLPTGQYTFECSTHDIYFGEMYHETEYVKSDQVLRVPTGWFHADENNRILKIYLFEKGSLIDISGRVIDSSGKGLDGILVSCSLLLDNDKLFWDTFKTHTTPNGDFTIPKLPPASIDKVVHFLLYGNSTYGRSLGIGLLQAELQIGRNHIELRKRVKLVSRRNLLPIKTRATKIREYGVLGGPKGFQYIDENFAIKEFPVSTNNIIHVGNIILPLEKE